VAPHALRAFPGAGRVWHDAPMARITGIGGVFFKARSDHKQLAAWYARHLGLVLEEWGGSILKWPDDKAADGGLTTWHVAAKNSEWFSPSTSSFMINYRVDDLDELLTQLRRDGIVIVKGPESDENGRFAWILDPDDNKVELWQPPSSDAKNTAP
jgi:predicted enzyme related to lactoylglutathione lyase